VQHAITSDETSRPQRKFASMFKGDKAKLKRQGPPVTAALGDQTEWRE
jgi:hypothetical protein